MTTTAPTTTTTGPSTTTTLGGATLSLTTDLVVTDTFAFGGTIHGNGHQIIVDGGSLDWDGVRLDHVSRVIHRGDCGVSTIRNVTATDMGAPELGFYPFHWHLCGDQTRGTLVENVTVDGSVNRAFVPHGSNGITFTDTAAYNIVGTPYWWDDPGTNETCSFQKFCTLDNSNDIIYDGVYVDGVVPFGGSAGNRNAGVQLGAGSGNVLRDAEVYNVEGGVDCSGFHWPESANQNYGGNVWVAENLHADSPDCHGIFVWQNDGNHHIVDGFTGGGIDHGAYGNDYDYRHVDVPYVEVHAVGWVMSDSTVGEVILRPHQFSGSVTWTNVDVGHITVRDAPAGSADEPVMFVVDGTDATCADVSYPDAHPDTRVILNGSMCERF